MLEAEWHLLAVPWRNGGDGERGGGGLCDEGGWWGGKQSGSSTTPLISDERYGIGVVFGFDGIRKLQKFLATTPSSITSGSAPSFCQRSQKLNFLNSFSVSHRSEGQ